MSGAWPGAQAASTFEFGDPLRDTTVLEEGAVKCALLGLRVIHVSGADAVSFIHAQFTADCRSLAPSTHLLTAWCSPKGRVLFAPQLIATGDGFELLLPTAQSEAFARRLRMFVLRAKVEIHEANESQGVMQLASPTPLARPREFEALADTACASSSNGRLHWLIGPHATLAAIWSDLPAVAVGSNAAQLLALRAGLFDLEAATADAFLPQELDLDRTAGVSFEKGCYPGQEIVARVRFRGSVKRRLARLACPGASTPAPGTRLLTASDVAVGTVLGAARASAQSIEMLAVLDVDAPAIHLADSTVEAVLLSRWAA